MADNPKIYINKVTEVILGLKNECSKYEYCNTKCAFYNRNDSSCLLKGCPCDYDMIKIEKAVSQIIDTEMNNF